MIDKKIHRIAIIGAGGMARNHIKAFQDIDGVEVVGIFSRTKEKSEILASDYSIGIVADSIEELYTCTLADLVVVAVPVLETAGVVRRVFEFPWVSLIEKPVGYNYQEAADLVALASKLKARSYVALNRRHLSSTNAVINELAESKSQRIVHVYDQETPEIEVEEGAAALLVENWMFGNSIHVLDYFYLFARGELVSIDHIAPWGSDSKNLCMAKLTFSSGDIGIYEAIWDAPGPWAVTVTTKEKRWEMRPLEKAYVQNYRSRVLEALPVGHWDSEFKPGLRVQAQEAVNLLDKLPSKLPSLGDALRTMGLVKAIYEI